MQFLVILSWQNEWCFVLFSFCACRSISDKQTNQSSRWQCIYPLSNEEWDAANRRWERPKDHSVGSWLESRKGNWGKKARVVQQGSCINKVWSAILSIPIFLRVSAVRMTAYLLVAIFLSGRLCFVIKSISIFSLEISPRELYLQLLHCFFCSSYFWVFALVLPVFF